IEQVLQSIKQKTLIVGITSDILCPVVEQKFIAGHLPNATFREIDSLYGHDGFLIERKKISHLLSAWMDNRDM
ncbi:MAG TPA: homoserine O-acetyltransferase, partial [Segetibacter sp.]